MAKLLWKNDACKKNIWIIGLFLILTSYFSPLNLSSSEAGVRVLWLQRGTGKDTFERGFETMQSTLKKEKKRTNHLLWDVMNLYVIEQSIQFDTKDLKIKVVFKAQSTPEKNTITSCHALISKARTVLFGAQPFTALNQYFPGIKQEDLRFFVYLYGQVDTVAYKYDDNQEALEPDKDYKPIDIVPIQTTKCKANAVSETISNLD